MKKGFFILLLVLASQSYGYQNGSDSTFAFADLLVWKLRTGGADNWAQSISPDGVFKTADILQVPFRWDTGLRLGIGHNNPYSHWDTILTYTWFQTNGFSQANVTTGGIYSPFIGNFYINNTNGSNFGPNYYNAEIQWKLYFNIFDLELGRKFYIDQYLHLRPFIGLKGGFINQWMDTQWQNPTIATTFTSATENLKNNFAGIGPSVGVNTTWLLYKAFKNSFNIIGNFSGALLYGHWSFTDLYENNTPASVAVNVESINGAASMARALLGVEWFGLFLKTQMTIRLGYEAQIWFNQLQYYSFNMGRLNNLMSLQGAVLGFCFYF